MTVTINGSGSITEEITIDGVKVGQGGGNVATNTAVGASALAANTTGNNNTAIGSQAGNAQVTGASLTAVGYQAARLTTVGQVSAFGDRALRDNTTGSNLASFGYASLLLNTTGSYNSAFGDQALFSNTTGLYNTAVGYQAGYTNAEGSANTFLGYTAGYSFAGSAASTYNTFLGYGAGYSVTTGTKNTIIGTYSGNQGGLDIRTASNRIVLSDGDGNPRMHFLSAGEPVIPRLTSSTTGSAANVFVSSTTGELVRSTSSLKYKRDVQDATHGLTEVLQLRPVTYKGKSQVDGETVFGGLIAEEVHDAGLTEFVQYAADGTPDALAYGNMVSLCVKAIQELSAQVTALQAEVNALKGQ